jgi:hypothetical protein
MTQTIAQNVWLEGDPNAPGILLATLSWRRWNEFCVDGLVNYPDDASRCGKQVRDVLL